MLLWCLTFFTYIMSSRQTLRMMPYHTKLLIILYDARYERWIQAAMWYTWQREEMRNICRQFNCLKTILIFYRYRLNKSERRARARENDTLRVTSRYTVTSRTYSRYWRPTQKDPDLTGAEFWSGTWIVISAISSRLSQILHWYGRSSQDVQTNSW